jgi:PhzF family phenazine biosynthesis protein
VETTVVFRLVDAFAESAFSGNPAGVVLDADALDERQMQLIAREVNAAETAFLIGGNDRHRPPRLRWFTPTKEVGFCGHATLGMAHAWSEALGPDRVQHLAGGVLDFETTAGVLRVSPEALSNRPENPVWWLRMPDPGLRPDNTNPMKTCELLGLTMDDLEASVGFVRTRDEDVIVMIKSWTRLNELRPNFKALADWSERHHVRGWFVTTRESLNESVNAVSRFFAPAFGIDEDPVTGSAHGGLAAFLVANRFVTLIEGRAALTCIQGIPGGRAGYVRVMLESTASGMRVDVGGCCHTTIRGEMRVPDRGRFEQSDR